MKFRRRATPVQAVMVTLMAVAVGALVAWLVPELVGVFSPAGEDTYSEWVWDQPLGVVWAIVIVHGVVAVAAGWSAVHFLRGWKRRRTIERRR